MTITLYRAVDAAEMESIRSTGRFLPSPSGADYKGFFFSEQSADRFGVQQAAIGGPETVVVAALASKEIVDASPKHNAATEGPGVYISKEDLKQVQVHG